MKPNITPLEPLAADQHPTVSTLRAYVADELSPTQDASLRAHLAECHTCVGLVLELADGVDTGSNVDEASASTPGEFDTERAWRQARARLYRPRRSSSTLWGLAAAAVLAAGFGLPQLLGPGNENAPIHLTPLAATRGNTKEGPCSTLPSGVEKWSVVMPVKDHSGPLTLRILTDEQRLLVTRSLSTTRTDGAATELDAATLENGTYRFQLVAAPAGEPRLVAQFCVEIR